MKNTNSIAIVFNGLYVGGAEKFGISLANKFVENGFNTTIFLFKDINSPLFDQIEKRINIVYILRRSKYDYMLHRQFDLEIKQRNINKVVILGLLPLLLSRFMSFKRNKNISYFISLHSSIPPSFKIYMQNMLCLLYTRKTDKVLFVCHNQKKIWSAKYLFNPQQYDVIYNGVDIEYFKPGAGPEVANQKETMLIPPADKVILLVATIRQEKGHAYAIESLNILHTKYADKQNTHLIFLGDGDENYISELKKIVNHYSLNSFVHFEGNQKDVRKYLEIADVFTLTSSSETFSIAALEAMCYGIPISLTNIGGASEMVFEGKNGLLSIAQNANSIALTWANLLDASFNKIAIRKIAVENFSLDLMFAKYLRTIIE